MPDRHGRTPQVVWPATRLDLSAYRILQDGLPNALKHAKARAAEVDVDYGATELRLEVCDDGRWGNRGRPAPAGAATGRWRR